MPTIDTKDFPQGKEAASNSLPSSPDYRISPSQKNDATSDYRVMPGSGQKSAFRDPAESGGGGKSDFETFINDPEEPSGNDSEFEKFLTGDNSKLSLSYNEGAKKNPDQASRILQLQARTGLPEDLIERNTDLIEKESKKADFDPAKFRKSSPVVAQWMSESPNHAAAASDDINQLSYLERQIRYISDQKRRGDLTVELNQIGTSALFSQATPEQRKRQAEIEKDLSDQNDYDITGFIEQIPGAVANQLPIWKQTVTSGLGGAGVGATIGAGAGAATGALAGGVGAVPGAVAGAGVGAARGWMAGAAVEAARMEGSLAYLDYEKIKDRDGIPLDRATAVGASMIVGVTNGALEMVGLHTVLKNAPGLRTLTRSGVKQLLKSQTASEAFRTFAKNIGEAILTEGATEFSQELVTKTMGGILQAVQNGDLKNMSTEAVLSTMSEAVQAGRAGMQAGGGMSAISGVPSVAMDVRRAKQAESNAQVFKAIGEGLQNTKMYEKLPVKTQELVERMTKDGPAENVYVPVEAWNEYWQSKKVDPGEVAQEILGNSESYTEANRTGGDIQIPTARYATTLAPTEHNAFFSEELRANPTDMNAREGKEFMAQMDAKEEEQLKAEVPPSEQVSRVILDRATSKLTEAGFDEETAVTYAKLYEQGFQSLAKREGVDPVQLFERFGLKINRPEEQVTEDETALEQSPLSPLGFFSQVEKQVQDMDFKEMPAKDLANRIVNIQGIKKEELEEIGIVEWLQTLSTAPEESEVVGGDPELYKSIKSGRVTKDQVLEFIRNNGVKVEQVVLGQRLEKGRKVRPPGDAPMVYELSWGEGEAQQPSDDFIESEAENIIFEYAETDGDHAYFGKQWKEKADDIFREDLIDDKKYVLSYSVDEDGYLSDEVQLTWGSNGFPDGAEGVNFGSGKAGEKRKSAFVKKLEAELTYHFQDQAEEAAQERYWDDDDYVDYVFTERETGWTLTGRTADEHWHSPETGESYDGTIEEAQIKLLQDMLEKGVIKDGNEENIDFNAPPPESIDVNKPTGIAKFDRYKVPGGENYREILLTLPNVSPAFTGGHFSEKNVLAHVRLTDRETADGKKTLFVEELQSDWHQKGRELGYQGESGEIPSSHKLMSSKEYWAEQGKPEQDTRSEWYVIDPDNRIAGMGPTESAAKGDFFKINSSNIPDAPFKQTDAWAALAMKRILRLAVEQGYDAVAIAPSEVHVDRWGTDSVSWVKRNDNGFILTDTTGDSPLTARLFSTKEAAETEIKNKDLSDVEVKEVGPHWLVGSVEQIGGRAGGVDIEGEARRRGHLLERDGAIVTSKEELQSVIADSLGRERRERSLESLTEQVWKQMQDKESGVKAPRKEGFEFFYDNLLPKKVLPKILKSLDKDAKVTVSQIKIDDNEDGLLQSWVVNLSPEMKTKIMEGMSLFQPGDNEDGPRGRIRFSGSGQEFNIDLLKDADLSTFLHETGHFYLEVMKNLAAGESASEGIKADFQSALNWLGISEGQEITREAHEKWARGFEAYLMEGKAPTPELRTAFARFKSWLTEIYKQITKLNVELTDEVRGVFDRLLATEEQIAQAEQQQNFQPLFPDPQAVGMNEQQAKDYGQAILDVREQAREELSQKLLAEEARKNKSWWLAEREKARAEIEQEVNEEKVYFALSILQRGKFPDGSEAPEGFPQNLKLNRDALYKAFPKELIKKLPRPYIYAAEGGIHHDEAAVLFGYASAAEMINEFANAEDREELIERLTDERMKQTHGDMLTDGTLSVEAMKAVHTEKRSQLLRRELEILATQDLSKLKGIIRKVTRRIPTVAMVRAQAEAAISRKKVRDINPFLYQRAESKAAKEAIEAVLKGDFDAAFEARQRELLNHEYYRAATAAREEIDSIVDYMGRFNRPAPRERLGKAGHDYLEQIDGILERFDFRKGISNKKLDKRASLLKWVQGQQAMGLTIEVPEHLLNEANRQHYKDTQYSELSEIRDTVKNIEHLAKLKNELLASGRKRELEAATDEIVAVISAHHNITKEPLDLAPSIAATMKEKALVGIAAHTKMEFLFDFLDGYKRGPVWEYLFLPFAKAEDAENTMMREAVESVNKIFERYTRKERAFWFLDKVFVPEAKNGEINGSFTKANLLSVALNTGNAYNKEALMRGYGWTEPQVQAILSHLDERDWQAVQAIWDYVDSYWPQIAAMEQKLNGLAPEKVEATAVETKFGKLRGGYYPIVFDAKRSHRQHQLDSASNVKEMFGGNFAKAMTKHGHTIARDDTGGKPLRLDLSGLTQHITNVIHDLTHREAIIDVSRIVSQPKVREAIEAAAGTEMFRQINPWLNSIASDRRGEYANPMESLLGRARTGATIVNMGWKFTTALVQFTGYSVSTKEIGAKYAAKGLHESFGNPAEIKKNWEFITSRSTMMANRLSNYDRDVRDSMKRLNVVGVKPGVLSVADAYTGELKDSWFVMVGYMDLAVSMPTWLGAYRKAMDGAVEEIEKGNEIQAVEFADKTVRMSQGAGANKDLALVQRGNEAFRLFTMFYSFWNVAFNQFQKTKNQFRLEKNVPKLIASLALIWFLPGVLEDLMLGRGPDDDADDKEWMRWFLKKEITYPFQSVVLMRDVVNGMGEYGYNASAAFDAMEHISKSGKILLDRSVGEKEELERKDYKSLVMTTGYLAGLPTRQIWLTGEYFHDWLISGEEHPENVVEGLWRGIVTGKPKR